MDKKKYKESIIDLLKGDWVLQYDTPTQWLRFSKPTVEDVLGTLIMANSEDLVKNRQRVEYEILIEDDLKRVYLNIYVKTAKQVKQYLINMLNSDKGLLWLDESTGEKWNYLKIQSQP